MRNLYSPVNSSQLVFAAWRKHSKSTFRANGLKAAILHNGNELPPIPVAYVTHLNES